ncbi:hypothetical protein Tco_0103170 [Tanacetum coccineum]
MEQNVNEVSSRENPRALCDPTSEVRYSKRVRLELCSNLHPPSSSSFCNSHHPSLSSSDGFNIYNCHIRYAGWSSQDPPQFLLIHFSIRSHAMYLVIRAVVRPSQIEADPSLVPLAPHPEAQWNPLWLKLI